MPPRIPANWPWVPSRTAVASLNGLDHALYVRTFASTPASLALGPESPNYIEVPKPSQPTFPFKPIVKGHLPVPRDIFRTRNAHPKQSKVFLDRSTRPPKELKAPGPYSRDAEYRLYKQRLAEKRREALRQGVKELHQRKVTTEAQHLARVQANYADRRQRAMAPPRTVDVLTQTSIQKGIREFLEGTLPDSSRTTITPARREAYEARVAKVQAMRESRLHDLYINARQFIVDEQQLDEAIEKTFGTEESPIGWDVKGNMGPRAEGKEGLSPWYGLLPDGVGDMMRNLKGGAGVKLATDRVRKLAEEFTGGKM